MAKKESLKVREIPLKEIDEPVGIIRLEINSEEVESLASSIREVGLLIPIGVRRKGERFEIVDGHRRYLAHKRLKRDKIPCIVRSVDDVGCAIARATENLRRVDLTPIEEAAIYADLSGSFGLTHDEIGRRMGKSAGVVRRRLDLLKMPESLQKAIHRKQITYGVAEELWRLKDVGRIDYYLGYAVDHGVTVAVARQWVQDEFKSRRHTSADIEEGRDGLSPLDDNPIYISCSTCKGAVELGKDILFRCCKACAGEIIKAIQGGNT